MFRRLCVCALLLLPTLAPAASVSDQIKDLQRDVAQLQDMMKQLQRSQDEKLAAIQALVQQSLGSTNDAGKAVAVIQAGLQQSLKDIESKVTTPIAGLTTRMDQTSNDLRTLQGAVSDLTALMARLQTQLTDVNNNLKVIQTPASAPPASQGPPQGAAAAEPAVPPMSAADLYANAERDRRGGRLDIALQEYADFLKYYGNTSQAPDAQFYIGYIHYGQKDFESAARDFDLVLEKYPTDNKRVPVSFYYKGMSLEQIPGHKTDAASEFKELIKQFPNDDNSKKACTELEKLGYHCAPPKAAAPAKGPRSGGKATARKKK